MATFLFLLALVWELTLTQILLRNTLIFKVLGPFSIKIRLRKLLR